jgi:HSP20 family protein
METTTTTHPTRTPRLDIFESEADFLYVLDVPGATRDQIDVSLGDGALRVRAEVSASDEGEPTVLYVWEREIGLPRSIDDTKVRAEFDAGVLEVRVARSITARKVAVA